MLGWAIGVYRQQESSLSPARFETELGARLAVWQTGIHGLDWIDELVEAGKAIDLGGNGYPYRYTAPAACLLPRIIHPPNFEQDQRVIYEDADGNAQPPLPRGVWRTDPHDGVTSDWVGRDVTDRTEASLCHPDEWLVVEAWDES